MKHVHMQSRQKGLALILSLLILLTMTIVGVAAMNSTIMQERMAGNARTQADVFETSSEGVTRALELFYDNVGAFTFGPNELSCGQVFGDTLANRDALAWDFPADGSWYLASESGDNPKLEQRMYCCRSWEEFDDGSGGTAWVEQTSKLFGLNRATFMGGADSSESLALREIEVEMAEAEPDDPTCAICVPGNMGTVSGPNSGSLNVSGSCGAAVVTDRATDPDAATTFTAGIGSASIGNFDGGVVGAELPEPWNSPEALAEFVFWVKLGLKGGSTPGEAGVGDSNVRGLYIDGDHTDTGNSSYGTAANPQITYIDGDADFGGRISGAGIMVTRGSLSWTGTPNFYGLLVSLGGGYLIDGGGEGGDPSGSMVITDLDYIDLGSGDRNDLYGREVLRYRVARNSGAQEVLMYKKAEYPESSEVRKARGSGFTGSGAADEVPARPILVDSLDRELIHYDAGTPGDISDDRFFLADGSGSEAARPDPLDWTLGNDFVLLNPDTGLPDVFVKYQDDTGPPTRDAYGRLIPDFVLLDNYPDDYGYNPNLWSWDTAAADAQFEWGTTDFTWGGGGNQNFTYDCRGLQKAKHELLCAQPLQASLPGPNDDFYTDPEAHYGEYCWHSVAGVEGGTSGGTDGKYFQDYETPPTPTTGRPENQKAWHMWSPSCDCLGISVDADMIVTGWRENLGWRDDQEFQGCSGLPSPTGS